MNSVTQPSIEPGGKRVGPDMALKVRPETPLPPWGRGQGEGVFFGRTLNECADHAPPGRSHTALWEHPPTTAGPPVGLTGFDDLSQQLRAMLEAFTTSGEFLCAHPRGWQPRINVYEWPDRFVVCVELAGMPREAIDVRAQAGELVISGSRPKPALPAQPLDIGVHLMEIDSGRFERRLNLPADVDVDRITARYRDGMLWIELQREPE